VFHVRPIRCRTHDCFSYDGSNSDSRAAGCAASVANLSGSAVASRAGVCRSDCARIFGAGHHRAHRNSCSAHADERRQKQVDKSRRHGARGGRFSSDHRDQLAIPAGTFVDGDVLQVTARPKAGQQPSFRVHFTRLVFSNGYSVALNGENTQALVLPLDSSLPANEVAELAPLRLPGSRFAMGEGQQTQLPTLPRVGPNPAVVGGAIGGRFCRPRRPDACLGTSQCE
jgi:hypothetical protein